MTKKHKRHSSSLSSSKRTPPSVPKCVRKNADLGGYVTEYTNCKLAGNSEQIRFLFKKLPGGYGIYLCKASDNQWRCVQSDISFSPATRQHLSTQSTLSKAIDAVESWLGYKLPDIR